MLPTSNIVATSIATAAAIGTLFAAFMAYRNTLATRKQSYGDFLFRLDQAFSNHREVRVNLDKAWSESKELTEFSDGPSIWSYMSLYEPIHLLVENKIIDIDTIDRLYGFRFFYLLRDPYVRRDVVSHKTLWIDFIKLWIKLEQTRDKSSREFPTGYRLISPNERQTLQTVVSLSNSSKVLQWILEPTNFAE